MKAILHVGGLLLISLIVFGQSTGDWSKISIPLQERLMSRSTEPVEVILLMKEQVDLDALSDSLDASGITLSQKATIINKRLRQLAADTHVKMGDTWRETGINLEQFWIVNAYYGSISLSDIERLSLEAEVAFIDIDVAPILDEPTLRDYSSGSRSVVPNGREIGLSVIKAPEMWKRGYTGYGTKALIIDTGVDPTHPALKRNFAGNILPEAQVWFTGSPIRRPEDCGDHGTHVTGTVLGIDRQTRDTIGVAFNAMWMGSAGLCGGNNVLIRSFQWALDPDGNPDTTDDMPDVINNSWRSGQGDECNGAFLQVFTALEASGVAIVFSAGNDGPGDLTITPPKNINKTLTNSFAVGAVDARNLNIAGFSSRGPSQCGGEGSLLIKPEVSAPGVQVRSSIPEGRYAFFNGTSMAAPHTSGALLLLKEAFPYLSGETLKLALYFSAVDLGDPGEDNVFGMGLIDVDAAFKYLLDQGYEPVSPVKSIDIAIKDYQIEIDYCNGTAQITLDIENEGTQNINDYSIRIETSGDKNIVWTRDFNTRIASGRRLLSSFDVSIDLWDNGPLSIIVMTGNDQEDERPFNNIIALELQVQSVPDWNFNLNEEALSKVVCSGTRIEINHTDANGTLLWYNQESDTTPFFIGNQMTFEAPEVDGPIDLFVGRKLEQTLVKPIQATPPFLVMPEEWTGIEFWAHQNVILKSFVLNNTARAFHTIKVLDDRDNQIWEANRFYNAGENVFQLNVTLQAGRAYRIVTKSNRNFETADFEESNYERFDGYVTILHALINDRIDRNILAGIYALTFETEVPCQKKRIRFQVRNRNTTPRANFDWQASENEVMLSDPLQLINLSDQSTDYEWLLNGTLISNAFEPFITFDRAGENRITLKAMHTNGCVDFQSRSLQVIDDVLLQASIEDIDQQIQLYPNPARSTNEIFLKTDKQLIQSVELIASDGRILVQRTDFPTSQSEQTLQWAGRNLSPGVYFVKITLQQENVVVKKLVVLD
jgi:subtilisin family serine protease